MGTAEIKFNAPKNTPDGIAPLECAETSALGRALAFAGLGTIESIASYEEITRGQPFTKIIEQAPGGQIIDSHQNGRQALPPAQQEPEPDSPATSQQIASIEKLCEKLKKPMPQIPSLGEARQIIRSLAEELKAAQSNGHQQAPQQAEGTQMITEQQLNALLNLYGKLEIDLPSDLDKWSYEQASVGIKELAAQLRAAKAS